MKVTGKDYPIYIYILWEIKHVWNHQPVLVECGVMDGYGIHDDTTERHVFSLSLSLSLSLPPRPSGFPLVPSGELT